MLTQNYLFQPPPAKQRAGPKQAWWLMPLAALAGGLLAYVTIRSLLTPALVAEIKALSGWQDLLVMASFPVAVWIAIILHETGHLLGGTIAGMRPQLLFAGPLKVLFGKGIPRLSWNPIISTWGGLAIATPLAGRANRGMLALMIAAGPALSLLTALVGWIIAASLEDAARISVGLFAGVSTAIGVATLIPLRAGGFVSDGGQLLQLISNSATVDAKLMLSVVIGESLSDVRPRDWSVALVEDAIAGVCDPILRTSGLSLLAASADDSDNLEKAQVAYEAFAKQLHEGGFHSYPRAFRGDLVLPVAIFLAERLNEPNAAKRWIEVGQDHVLAKYLLFYAKAVCAKANGDSQASRSLAIQAYEALPRTSGNGAVIPHRERLRVLAHAELEKPVMRE